VEGAFYAKEVRDGAIVLRAVAETPDAALAAARERLDRMLEHAPAVRQNLESAQIELRVTAPGQRISDLPELRHRRGTRAGRDDFDERTRAGGHQELRFGVCATETLLGGAGDRQPGHDLCVHELAHVVYWRGLGPPVRSRVLSRYRAALAEGRWRGTYAAGDHAEFFAELSMWYFDSEGAGAPELPKGRGRDWLRSYDPESSALLDAIYAGRVDPGTAPRLPVPASAPGALRSTAAEVPVVIEIANATGGPLRVAWIDYQGTRRPAFDIAPGHAGEAYTYATHPWAVSDSAGRERGVYVAGVSDGLVTIAADR
jgi:hypothetical protein